jgi:two-component system phosphate regulon response regulator OmpR
MSLVVPAESTETVHHETDRVERILVVDDDVRLRTLLQRFLEDKGFVVKLPMMQRKWIVYYNVNCFR